jgi:flavin reductase (DIM6/NTAB) family NADH-FMN oxidoreductase RutF
MFTIKIVLMITYADTDIADWDRFYRANFINSLTGFKSASLIGTANTTGQPNLAIFSSIVHIGSNPALVGYINRPVQASTHTLANIQATGMYTINHIHPSFLQQAHQTSAKYAADISEFEEVGLTAAYSDGILAPFVKESHIKYALSLQEIIPITLNNTFLVIGKIKTVYIKEGILTNDGFLAIDQANSVCSNGIDAYYSASFINRYKYAKTGLIPQ